LPRLDSDVYQAWKDQGLIAFAISSSTIGAEDPTDLAEYVDGMGLTMTVLADYEADTYADYDFDDPDQYSPYPREFIVDQDGNIAYLDSDIDVEALEAVLEELLQ
jgi:peroxiredoxin